ncbi:MAG: GHKL domain-containing protein [Tissierella sp.]|nr:GHKL domain-containing protein [Tissierella sp.]
MFKTYEEYLPIIEDLMEEIRYRQHQFDDHIQAIRMLAMTGDNLESTVKKMKGYAEDIVLNSKITKLIKLDNRILSGFLYEKYRSAEAMGVDFTIIIDDYEFKTNLKDYELVEIVGNLINNAFESNTKDNKVILNLTAEDDMGLIEIKNKYPFLNSSGISQLFMSGYSTKSKDGRGIGLPNVRKIISNHGGMLQVQNDTIDDENYLVFRILLKKYK